MDEKLLIQKYMDGTISEEELPVLYAVLSKDRNLAKDFLRELHLENALECFFEDKSIKFTSSGQGTLTDEDIEDVNAAGAGEQIHPLDPITGKPLF